MKFKHSFWYPDYKTKIQRRRRSHIRWLSMCCFQTIAPWSMFITKTVNCFLCRSSTKQTTPGRIIDFHSSNFSEEDSNTSTIPVVSFLYELPNKLRISILLYLVKFILGLDPAIWKILDTVSRNQSKIKILFLFYAISSI